jgi:hypothetical protein
MRQRRKSYITVSFTRIFLLRVFMPVGASHPTSYQFEGRIFNTDNTCIGAHELHTRRIRRDKTVPWQVQRRLMQAMTNSPYCSQLEGVFLLFLLARCPKCRAKTVRAEISWRLYVLAVMLAGAGKKNEKETLLAPCTTFQSHSTLHTLHSPVSLSPQIPLSPYSRTLACVTFLNLLSSSSFRIY